MTAVLWMPSPQPKAGDSADSPGSSEAEGRVTAEPQISPTGRLDAAFGRVLNRSRTDEPLHRVPHSLGGTNTHPGPPAEARFFFGLGFGTPGEKVAQGHGQSERVTVTRMMWPDICPSDSTPGGGSLSTTCRYDPHGAAPRGRCGRRGRGLGELCARMRESDRTSCAILFCDEDVFAAPVITRPSQVPPPAPLITDGRLKRHRCSDRGASEADARTSGLGTAASAQDGLEDGLAVLDDHLVVDLLGGVRRGASRPGRAGSRRASRR